MSVLVLMYHATPVEAETPYDVPLARFREQIDRLIDAGTNFIPFARVGDLALRSRGRHVAVTFDDGHGSNAAAVEYLAERNISPTLFIVREWSESGADHIGRNRFLRPSDLRGLSSMCTLGAHGETHRGFSGLAGAALDLELASCRQFLGEITGAPPQELALPGGDGNVPAILAQCYNHGFSTVGNSIFDVNGPNPVASYARPVIMGSNETTVPVRLATLSDASWALLRTARAAKRRIRSFLSRGD